MKTYTYQIGDGDGETITTLTHSRTLAAEDIQDAIRQAKKITQSFPLNEKENTTRLLEEGDSDHVIMWVRPVGAIRNA